MSATNRGAERAPDDYYATPAWVVDQLLGHLSIDPGTLFIDPGCGDGAIMERAIMTAKLPAGSVFGVEVDKARAQLARERFAGCAVVDGDYLSDEVRDYLLRLRGGPFVIIGNPPYSHAMEFAQQSIDIASERPGSIVALLLRLAILETPKRSAFHREHPAHLFVLPKRPSFCHSFKCEGTPGGERHEKVQLAKSTTISKLACPTCGRNMQKTTSDATAYAWLVWGDSKPGRWEIL